MSRIRKIARALSASPTYRLVVVGFLSFNLASGHWIVALLMVPSALIGLADTIFDEFFDEPARVSVGEPAAKEKK